MIDLGDATLLPGFIDAHTHLDQRVAEGLLQGVLRRRCCAFRSSRRTTAALYAKRTLEAGFTTVRNVGAGDFIDIGLRNAINDGVDRRPAHDHRRALDRLDRRPLRQRPVPAGRHQAARTDRRRLQWRRTNAARPCAIR